MRRISTKAPTIVRFFHRRAFSNLTHSAAVKAGLQYLQDILFVGHVNLSV